MDPEAQWEEFLAKFLPETADLARRLLDDMRAMLPGAVEMVYDNYNFLVVGFGPNEKAGQAILSLAVAPLWVTLCFLHGAGLPDPHGLLQGDGNQVRHIRLKEQGALFDSRIRDLIEVAVASAKTPIDPSNTRYMVVKSVSVKQRPRRP